MTGSNIGRLDAVEVDGVALAYRVAGDSGCPPMVLLHGLGDDERDWLTVLSTLADQYRVYALDLRGHGRSAHPGRYSFEVMRDDVIGFLDALGVPPCVMIGHSMGGTVAILLAEAAPHRLTHLILEDATAPRPGVFKRPALPPPDTPTPFDFAAVNAIRTQLNDPDPAWWDRIGAVEVPTLIIGATRSHIPQHLLAETVDRMPNAALVTIDAGVDTAWPAGVRDLLDRILASLDHPGTVVALPPLGTVTLTYSRPAESSIVTGYVRTGLSTAVLTVMLNAVVDTGLADLNIMVGGKPFGVSTVECLMSAVSGLHQLNSLDAHQIADAIVKFSSCALGIVDAERQALVLSNDGARPVVVKAGAVDRYKWLSLAHDALRWYTLARAVAQLSDIALDERADIRDGVDLTLDLRGADLIVLTPTSVAGVAVGGSAANADKKLRQLLGAPTTQDNVPGCSLSTPASDSRRLTSWGSLTLVAGSSGSSKGKVVGWTVRAGPLPATVRLPYSVTTATPVSTAMNLIPGATAQWNDVFQMYMITTPHAGGMVWSGEQADGSGRITYISNAFEPCE